MTTMTVIRSFHAPGDFKAFVITVQLPTNFIAQFQLYEPGIQGQLIHSMRWRSETKAIAQFERFLDAWRYLNSPVHLNRDETLTEREARLESLIDHYVADRVAEGYDETVARTEAMVFYHYPK